MKIGIAQIQPLAGDIEYNIRRHKPFGGIGQTVYGIRKTLDRIFLSSTENSLRRFALIELGKSSC